MYWMKITTKVNFLFFVFCFSLFFSAEGQLVEQKKIFSKADTLRGSLRPERTCYDVKFYELHVEIDTSNKTIKGSNEIFFTATQDINAMQVDLSDSFVVDKITFQGKPVFFAREYNALFLAFFKPIGKGVETSIKIEYHGRPIIAKRAPWDGGFVWKHDDNGKAWIAVACEGLGASSWWPCKDHLSDEPDYGMRIECTVPDGLKCISNGNLEFEFPNKGRNTTTYSWRVSYPINTYNVTLNIGDYTHFGERYTAQDGDSLALDYYVLSYNLEKAKKQFEQVKPMMKVYEKYLGKYPFWKDGYALVETPYLGMEHQGAIAYGNKYKSGYNGIDFSKIGLKFDYIIIHETGHEWWGNSVSCKDIADMWIHESFCTYAEAIYVEVLHGKDTAQLYINAKKKDVDNKSPIQGPYGVNEEGDGDMYPKGSLMLNTMRTIVNNDALWWSTIKGISDTAFKLRNTDANEIIAYMNQRTGKNLEPILRQYIQHAAIPKVVYSLTKVKAKQYKFSFEWINDMKDEFLQMPVIVEFDGKQERVELPQVKNGDYFKKVSKYFKIADLSTFKINQELEYIDVVEVAAFKEKKEMKIKK